MFRRIGDGLVQYILGLIERHHRTIDHIRRIDLIFYDLPDPRTAGQMHFLFHSRQSHRHIGQIVDKFIPAALTQQHGKIIPAHMRCDLIFLQEGFDDLGKPADQLIPGLESQPLIDAAESFDVDIKCIIERQRYTLIHQPHDLPDITAVIEQSRQMMRGTAILKCPDCLQTQQIVINIHRIKFQDLLHLFIKRHAGGHKMKFQFIGITVLVLQYERLRPSLLHPAVFKQGKMFLVLDDRRISLLFRIQFINMVTRPHFQQSLA